MVFAEQLQAEEADGGVPDPGDEVSAQMEGEVVGEDGEVDVGGHEGGDGGGELEAGACGGVVRGVHAGAEEEQAAADRGEVPGAVARVVAWKKVGIRRLRMASRRTM